MDSFATLANFSLRYRRAVLLDDIGLNNIGGLGRIHFLVK